MKTPNRAAVPPGGQAVKNPLLSVVVTACHAEDGLRRCLDSLCRQDYPHLEIICVDDGSTDGSHSILREYECKDSRIRVVQQVPGGVGGALNTGMELAVGEWVAFAGADEYLLPRAYSTLMGVASPEVDMVTGGIRVEAASRAMKKQAAACRAAAKPPCSGVQRLDARHVPDHRFPLAATLFRRSLMEQHHLRMDNSLCVGGDLCWYMSFRARARAAYFCRKELFVCMLRDTPPPLACRDAGRWVDSYIAVVDKLVTLCRQEGLLHEYLPWFTSLLLRTQAELCQWAVVDVSLLPSHERLLQLLRTQGLHREPALLPLIHDMEEQQRTAVRARELLHAACEPACSPEPPEAGMQHVAIPVDESRAGLAVVLAQSVKEHAAPGGRVCLHFVCAGVSKPTLLRMRRMAYGNAAVCIHECDTSLLRRLPPLPESTGFAYLKMSLPQLLPHVERAWLMEPGLLLTGPLPDINSYDMQGQPVAVAEDWPHAGSGNTPGGMTPLPGRTCAFLMADLGLMRRKQYADTWLALCLSGRQDHPLAEQQAFDWLFYGRTLILPEGLVPIRRATVPSLEVWTYQQHSPWANMPMDAARLYRGAPRPDVEGPAVCAEAHRLQGLSSQYGMLCRRYRYYKLMAMLTWGQRRRQYKEKRRLYRNVLQDIRQFRAQQRRDSGL